jgi:hypothetical protein
MGKQINFNANPADRDTIHAIAARVAKIWPQYDVMTARMDLTACHLNGCPMDLDRLLAADDFNLAHDMFGINRHLDRRTGQLTGHFLPRYAAPKAA